MCCRIGANEFETLNDAYAAVAQAGASVGVMVVKADAKKTQKLTPFKVMSPPFEEVVLVDGFYPQMSMRLRCDRKHAATYESVLMVTEVLDFCKGTSGKRSLSLGTKRQQRQKGRFNTHFAT